MEDRNENLSYKEMKRYTTYPDESVADDADNASIVLDNIDCIKYNLSKINVVKLQSKNLVNKDTIVRGKYLNLQNEEVTNASSFITDYIEVEPNQFYTISGCGMASGTSRSFVEYDADKNIVTSKIVYNRTYQMSEKTKYIRLSAVLLEPFQFQFELGEVATEYTDYVDTKGLTGYFKINF